MENENLLFIRPTVSRCRDPCKANSSLHDGEGREPTALPLDESPTRLIACEITTFNSQRSHFDQFFRFDVSRGADFC